MELSYDDVLEIIDIVEHSTVDYLELEIGETKIILDKSGTNLSPTSGRNQNVISQKPQTLEKTQPSNPVEAISPANINSGDNRESSVSPKTMSVDLIEIKAPVVGVFYRQSEPGAQPYVEIGSKISAGETVGLLEVMKMFTGVTSPIDGMVEQILVNNNDFVEFDQPLMLIRPGF